MTLKKILSAVASLLGALTATALSFFLVEWLSLQLLILIFVRSGDPSSGDSAGWGFIIEQPIIIPIGIVMSLACGGVVFYFCYTKLCGANKSADRMSH
jgi:hypothetical protein